VIYDRFEKDGQHLTDVEFLLPRHQLADGSRRPQDMTGIYENTHRIRTKTCVIFSVTYLLRYFVHMEAASPCETSVTT
jgi:hypothetical protein